MRTEQNMDTTFILTQFIRIRYLKPLSSSSKSVFTSKESVTNVSHKPYAFIFSAILVTGTLVEKVSLNNDAKFCIVILPFFSTSHLHINPKLSLLYSLHKIIPPATCKEAIASCYLNIQVHIHSLFCNFAEQPNLHISFHKLCAL